MKPGAVRTQLRLGQEAVARMAGVCRATIRQYESHPDAVGARDPEIRARIDWVYRELADLQRRAHERRSTAKAA
jgi:hypothetical protein